MLELRIECNGNTFEVSNATKKLFVSELDSMALFDLKARRRAWKVIDPSQKKKSRQPVQCAAHLHQTPTMITVNTKEGGTSALTNHQFDHRYSRPRARRNMVRLRRHEEMVYHHKVPLLISDVSNPVSARIWEDLRHCEVPMIFLANPNPDTQQGESWSTIAQMRGFSTTESFHVFLHHLSSRA